MNYSFFFVFFIWREKICLDRDSNPGLQHLSRGCFTSKLPRHVSRKGRLFLFSEIQVHVVIEILFVMYHRRMLLTFTYILDLQWRTTNIICINYKLWSIFVIIYFLNNFIRGEKICLDRNSVSSRCFTSKLPRHVPRIGRLFSLVRILLNQILLSEKIGHSLAVFGVKYVKDKCQSAP